MDLVKITLNYEGQDYLVEVDMETANILLNDPIQANQFIETVFLQNQQPMIEDYDPTLPSTSSASDMSSEPSSNEIWTSRRATQMDEVATDLFLELREKYSLQFDDKKTIKMQIWQKIANELTAHGYILGSNAGEKCRQKFANLQKQYIHHIQHMKRTGEEKKKPPPHFEKLHSILGAKDKIDPKKTQDSLIPNETAVDSGSTENVTNRFSSMRKKSPIKSNNEKYMNFLKTEMDKDRDVNQKQFETLCNLLDRQNDQRETMISIFKQFVGSKKRKRSEESDNSD